MSNHGRHGAAYGVALLRNLLRPNIDQSEKYEVEPLNSLRLLPTGYRSCCGADAVGRQRESNRSLIF